MPLSARRIEWLRGRVALQSVIDERCALAGALLKTSRLAYVLRSPLPVSESGREYEALLRDVRVRMLQLDCRVSYLSDYCRNRWP